MDGCRIFFIHTCVHGYLGWPHSSAVANGAVLDMDVQEALWADWASFGQRPITDATAGPHGSCIFSFCKELLC